MSEPRVLGWNAAAWTCAHAFARRAYPLVVDPDLSGAEDVQACWRTNWQCEPAANEHVEDVDSAWTRALFRSVDREARKG